LSALFLLAGCTTPPPAQPVPKEWSVSGSVSNQPAIPLRKLTPITNPPPRVVRTVNPVLVTTWTSLEHWAAAEKISVRRVMVSPTIAYAVMAQNNLIVLTIGSRDASYNGIQFHLGFAPEMIDDQIFVHGLDLQKNLEPLLNEPPLQFNGTNRVIVLDPGHGGMNGGTISVLDGRPEKEFTLDLARRLKPLLEAEGWKVFMTRTNDTDLALSNRVNFAESHHADCFISLHFNSSAPDKKQNGLETYCLTPTGMPSTITRDFADPWTENLPNNFFDADNIRFAVRLHKAILNATGEEDRGVRRARFIGVLRGQKRPALLIEGGYLSNPAEAAKIENPAFRQKLAEAIASALK